MTQKLRLSTSPHIYTSRTTSKVMLDVIIALLPATVAGSILFGLRSLAVIATCVITCVLFEALFAIITKREQTISDLSAVVTGLLIALNLSVNVPLWQAAIGSAFALIVVKCLFGGMDTTLTVSAPMHGEYGVEDVCLSTLNIVGPNGLGSKVMTPLTDEEIALLHKSANTLKDLIKGLDI